MDMSSIQNHSSSVKRFVIITAILMLSKSNIVFSQSSSIYNSGIQYSAYGGGKSFPSHIVEYRDNHQTGDDQNWKSEARSAKRNQPQQVDESMVASMLNNPDAMKMVLKYLTKQNLNEHQKKWNKMSKTKNSVCPDSFPQYEQHTESNHGDICRNGKHSRFKVGWSCPKGCFGIGNNVPYCMTSQFDDSPCRANSGKTSSKNNRKKSIAKKTTTAKPKTTTKKPKKSKTKSPILQITQIKRRNDNVKDSDGADKKKKKRRPRPKGDFFDLAQLFAQLGSQQPNRKKGDKSSKADKKRPPPDLSFLFGPPIKNRPPKDKKPSPKPTPPANFDDSNNPQLMGDKPKLEYFGPSDFVPTHPYALPMKQHGPMKLTYMSTKDFPNIPKYGLIPIPRR